MVATEVVEIVTEFVKALKKRGIRVERAFVYGSYAQGRPRKESDIDVAIVSPDFGRDRYEEGKLLRQIAWRIDSRLEPVPISKESFLKDDWIPLIHEIKTKGIPIKIAA
ncbi:MAG: nucleotidyltransferase domain-containing protein [Actinomycetota bacterium]|nr:nucleotidyltransferase domain-containing protein [Actinomycetota bacterium]